MLYLRINHKFKRMLVDFSVGNFRSIKEVQSLNLTAANIVSKYREVDEQNIFTIKKWSLLKSQALYGANASGKSNMIQGVVAFINIVKESVKNDYSLLKWIEPFSLSAEYEDKPTFFQMMFIMDGIFYRYGFEATTDRVQSEWLYGTPGKKEVQYFLRDGTSISINEKHFQEGVKLKELVRKDALFLTVTKSLNGELAGRITDFMTNITVVSGLSDKTAYNFALNALEDVVVKSKILTMLKLADVGIEDIRKFDLPLDTDEGIKGQNKSGDIFLASARKWLNPETNETQLKGFLFDKYESEGTKKMFEISPLIIRAMEQGYPFIMDEFDARFHPLLSKKLVQLFNSAANTKNAQFIFATHDTNLLDAHLLRRDQICFVEKDSQGASHFYTLAEFKGVRNDASFEKDYIKGKYGAIPFLGDFETIFE